MIAPVTLRLKRGDFDLRGYEVMRTQFFAAASITSVTFSCNYVRFSSACVRKFGGVEHIEMLVHPGKLHIAIRPCSDNHKNVMRWAKIQDDKISVRAVNGSAYFKTLYELFGWNPVLKYRLRGGIIQHDGEAAILFDVQEPEVFASRRDMRMPWAAGFGADYYGYKNSQVSGETIYNIFTEYSSEPELQPTAPEVVRESVRCLIENMQDGEGPYGDPTDILS